MFVVVTYKRGNATGYGEIWVDDKRKVRRKGKTKRNPKKSKKVVKVPE